ADLKLNKSSLSLEVGSGERLEASGEKSDAVQWLSSDPSVAQVYKNGFVVALHPGSAKISARSESARATECQLSVKDAMQPLIDPASLQQYEDNRAFAVNGRKCFGSDLNGQRAV